MTYYANVRVEALETFPELFILSQSIQTCTAPPLFLPSIKCRPYPFRYDRRPPSARLRGDSPHQLISRPSLFPPCRPVREPLDNCAPNVPGAHKSLLYVTSGPTAQAHERERPRERCPTPSETPSPFAALSCQTRSSSPRVAAQLVKHYEVLACHPIHAPLGCIV
jgi:hypothetical protein